MPVSGPIEPPRDRLAEEVRQILREDDYPRCYPPGVLGRVSRYLGREITEAQLTWLLRHCPRKKDMRTIVVRHFGLTGTPVKQCDLAREYGCSKANVHIKIHQWAEWAGRMLYANSDLSARR
jgi:hypothetical protein